MSPEEEARAAIRDAIWSLHDHGMDMGQISCLVLDEMISCFSGVNAIRRAINETDETLPEIAARHAERD